MGLLSWLRSAVKTPKAPTRDELAARRADHIAKLPPFAPSNRFAQLEAQMAPFARSCLLPTAVPGDSTDLISKFCGAAWLPRGEPWPTCTYCRGPMQLLAQVLTRELRPIDREITGDGLLQLFACVNDRCRGGPGQYAPFSGSHLARILPAAQLASDRGAVMPRPTNPAPNDATFPARRITAWREMIDYPGWGRESPEGWDEPEWNYFYEQVCHKHRTLTMPHAEDKIGGWPEWVQDVVEIDCPECGRRMELILQIDSEDNIPYMWGDAGVGHVQVCRDHPALCIHVGMQLSHR